MVLIELLCDVSSEFESEFPRDVCSEFGLISFFWRGTKDGSCLLKEYYRKVVYINGTILAGFWFALFREGV